MIFGTTTFKCNNCGECFDGIAAELCATTCIAPVKCPKCEGMHTYPIGIRNFMGILGPNSIYKKIWSTMDENE